ncbi:beta-N-acetylhexosaminidase [Terracoccus luteus]|uniref:Beta-N-acetylhexosaminidase n=1 Tax=Terracoccus luteus TaxID=53356 RepID=A0A495XY46_9MICO|nr:beta-N-acetylhexosaminidase [Terracoccus luteus]RKT79531.1 beta-N-acetylhexosaminidase [Terracoccus luteus]
MSALTSQESGPDEARAALRGLVAATLMPGFVGATVPDWVRRELRAGLRAVCLFGTNLVDEEQFCALCADLRSERDDLVLAVDEEGGDVTRLHYLTGSPQPGNAVLGRLDDVAVTRRSAAAIGRELAAHGITLDLAPVVDVNSADENPVIGVRSFGADPALAARHAAAFVEGLQSVGVAACAKHFPGHGDTVTDSHLALPRVDVPRDVLEARELVPFRAVVTAGAAAVMTSHIVVGAVDPDRPATMSSAVLGGLLRDELGYDGLVVSDALDMAGASAETGIPEAAVRALQAGCDLLCVGSRTTEAEYGEVLDALVAAVEQGRLPLERVREAAARVDAVAQAYPAVRGHKTATKAETEVGDRGSPTSDAEVQAAFETGPAFVSWRDAPGDVAVVQVASGANQAVGRVRWGPAAAGPTTDADAVAPGAKVAVVGRGLGPDHPAWGVATRLRETGHAVLVVECGWPRGGADLVTFGASLAVGRALRALLGADG